MRPVLNRLASDVRLMQRLVCQQRMMGSYTSPSPLTLKERTSVNNADMDSLPSPSGNWATEYAQAQTKYNISLAVSISLFAAVAYYFLSQGFVKKPANIYAPINLEEVFQARMANREE